MLKGKKILVVGASRGIGEAIALSYVKEGANVIITGRKEETLIPVVEKLREFDKNAGYIVWDISDVLRADEVIQKASDMMGGLDVVVNNAGVLDYQRLLEVDEKVWDKVFEINVKGAYFCAQAAIKYYLQNKTGDVKGKIIVISSETGHQPYALPYGISKWAVMGMCKGLAKVYFKDGIVIQNIAPGPVTTEMMGWSEGKSDAWGSAFTRMAYPEEVADLAVFLASDKSNRIAGMPVYINGGLNY